MPARFSCLRSHHRDITIIAACSWNHCSTAGAQQIDIGGLAIERRVTSAEVEGREGEQHVFRKFWQHRTRYMGYQAVAVEAFG